MTCFRKNWGKKVGSRTGQRRWYGDSPCKILSGISLACMLVVPTSETNGFTMKNKDQIAVSDYAVSKNGSKILAIYQIESQDKSYIYLHDTFGSGVSRVHVPDDVGYFSPYFHPINQNIVIFTSYCLNIKKCESEWFGIRLVEFDLKTGSHSFITNKYEEGKFEHGTQRGAYNFDGSEVAAVEIDILESEKRIIPYDTKNRITILQKNGNKKDLVPNEDFKFYFANVFGLRYVSDSVISMIGSGLINSETSRLKKIGGSSDTKNYFINTKSLDVQQNNFDMPADSIFTGVEYDSIRNRFYYVMRTRIENNILNKGYEYEVYEFDSRGSRQVTRSGYVIGNTSLSKDGSIFSAQIYNGSSNKKITNNNILIIDTESKLSTIKELNISDDESKLQ